MLSGNGINNGDAIVGAGALTACVAGAGDAIGGAGALTACVIGAGCAIGGAGALTTCVAGAGFETVCIGTTGRQPSSVEAAGFGNASGAVAGSQRSTAVSSLASNNSLGRRFASLPGSPQSLAVASGLVTTARHKRGRDRNIHVIPWNFGG